MITPSTKDEEIVLSRYRAMQRAMCDKDISALDEIVLDGTVFRHVSGVVQTKSEYFSDIKSGRLDYQKYRIENAKVAVEGNEAFLSARVTLTANAYGAFGSWPFNVKARFVKIDGVWRYTD